MFCRKLKVLTTATLLAGLTVLALACGPASPSGQGAAAQTETPTPTIQPTRTPYPSGYVKPTRLPTWTPFPTLAPDPTLTPTPEGVVPLGDNSGGSAPAPTPTLSEQVPQFAQEERDYYDAVARVRAISHRDVVVLDPQDESRWPPLQQPTFSDWSRTKVDVVKLYNEALWDDYEIVVPSRLVKKGELDVGKEYTLFIKHEFVKKDDFQGETNPMARFRFNQEQLDAFSGRGGVYFGDQVWIIDWEEDLASSPRPPPGQQHFRIRPSGSQGWREKYARVRTGGRYHRGLQVVESGICLKL